MIALQVLTFNSRGAEGNCFNMLKKTGLLSLLQVLIYDIAIGMWKEIISIKKGRLLQLLQVLTCKYYFRGAEGNYLNILTKTRLIIKIFTSIDL